MKGKLLFALVSFSIFLLLSIPVVAQLDISGRVFDNDSKESLVGVNVVVLNSTFGTASDNSGFFRLKTEIKLPCTIQLSMVGYKTAQVEIKKNQKELKFLLLRESILSEEITIKAKEIEVEEKTFRQVNSMEMMDALTIRETPSANFYEVIGHLKGVDVVMQSIQFMTVNARGFNSTENTRFVQVVDGMDNMATGMNFPIGNIAGLSELDVELIEFIPGPSEVQYGGNALNGVLKMISKDPFKYQGLSLYVKPGVSDIVPGNDHPFQFSGKPQFEGGFRLAKAFNNKIAFKINASYSAGTDWYAEDTTNIRPGNIKWEPDPGHDAINKYGDEIISDLPLGVVGANTIVARTGYNDKELVDNKVENLKISGAVHLKLNEKITAILLGNFGSATTVFTGDNRISLLGFKIYQGKAELKGEHFLLQGYSTIQNSGNSYDSKFLAVNLNNVAKSDEDWFHDYYNAYKGNYRMFGVLPFNHGEARRYADRDRLIPGSPEFNAAKQKIINNPDFREGAGIHNNSALYNFDGMVDLNKYTGKTKVSLGANYRFYDLDSQGSIFPDTLGNDITIYEYGAFVEAERDFLNDQLKVKTSIRYDKSENFEGHFSPRFSVLYTINEENNFRASVLTGFRNPGVKEQFINKNLGTARYLGGLGPILEPYDIPLNSIYLDNVNEFNEAVNTDMSDEKNPLGINQAMLNNLDILEAGIVQKDQVAQFKPEQVFSFELGYKTKIADILFLDAVYYNSLYKNFIGITKIVKPRTSPQVDLFTAATQINKSAQNDVYFVNVNSINPVGIQGISMGYKWLMPMGSILSGNLTWSDIRSGTSDPVAPGFNTPGFKSNMSLQNRRMDRMENNPGFKNIGFKVTWRFQNRYYWESAFGDGWIEPVSTFDLQFSVNMKKPKSIVKFGASNFFNNKFAYSFGGSNIGVLFYVTYLIDNIFSIK
ncbi:MAG: TonB-dependent receptor [Draconibacterium sp.]|nr:TonB-dependent receptor [Draconibacterium sp.]